MLSTKSCSMQMLPTFLVRPKMQSNSEEKLFLGDKKQMTQASEVLV